MKKYPLKFWVFMSVCFINSMAQMITLFISLFLHKHGVSVTHIGLLISIFGVGGVLGGFLGGYTSDHITPMTIVRISSLLNALLILSFPVTNSILVWGVILFFMGMFNNFFRPASLLLILAFNDIAKPSIIMSYRRVFVNLGVSFGVMLSGVLFNYNELFVFIASSSLVFISFIILMFLTIKVHKQSETTSNYKKSYKLYYALLLFTFALVAYNQQQSVYGIFLTDHLSLTAMHLSTLFAINGVLVVLCQIPITHYVRHISPYRLSAIGGLLIGLGFGVVILPGGYFIGVISIVMWSIGELLLFPSAFDIMLALGSNKKGRDMGMYQTAFSISALAGPLLGGLLYTSNVYLPWLLCILLGSITFIGFCLLGKTVKVLH